MNAYRVMKQAHQKEVNAFPFAFAFSEQQFEEGMRMLGLDPLETDKVYKLGDTGGFYRREDAPKLHEMFDRHHREMDEAIKQDATGDGFIYDMFNYELANHEYCITYSLDDTLDALGLSHDEINNDPRLLRGLRKACAAQTKK